MGSFLSLLLFSLPFPAINQLRCYGVTEIRARARANFNVRYFETQSFIIAKSAQYVIIVMHKNV